MIQDPRNNTSSAVSINNNVFEVVCLYKPRPEGWLKLARNVNTFRWSEYFVNMAAVFTLLQTKLFTS